MRCARHSGIKLCADGENISQVVAITILKLPTLYSQQLSCLKNPPLKRKEGKSNETSHKRGKI
jgi:hypothetical protein